jgi:flavin-dependent dehydrogenase
LWIIAGAGVAGSYLFSRMRQDGFSVTLYDPKFKGHYIPCGFATNSKLIEPYMMKAGIDLDQIIESRDDHVTLAGNNFKDIEVGSSGICTVNKMKMEELLNSGAATRSRPDDISGNTVVDCTGVSRYYLGKAEGDKKMYAIEKLVKKSPYSGFYFYFFPKGRGYFWSFPLKDGFHIGAGGIDLQEVKSFTDKVEGVRTMSRQIRMTPLMDFIWKGRTIGTGESIGYISPLLGEGIVPAMECSEQLFQSIKKTDDLESIKFAYKSKIESRMKQFKKLANLVTNIQEGKVVTISNLVSIRLALKELNKFGINVKAREILGHFL